MANDGQHYADYARSTANFYHDLPSNVSQDSFPSQPRLHERQMNNARHAMPVSRAMDGWNSINVHRSPNLGLDGEYPTSLGPGESYNNFRVSVAAQPSSYTPQVPSHMPYEVSPDPISRFQNYPGPWVPPGIADIPSYLYRRPRQSRSSNLRTRYSEPNASSFSQYQTKAGSELESDTTGPYPSDSGYGTRSQATTSILSSDPREQNQECSSITDHIDDLNFYPEDNFQAYPQPDKQARALRNEHRPNPDQSQSANLQCPYADCGSTVKCQSEMTKHIRRHVKPFKCDQPGCDRMQNGFSTTNDLDRHKKSRHHIAPKHGHDRSFRCPVANCSQKDKVWPRLDNFRQHLKRMHNLEATDEVIAKAVLENYNRLQAQSLESGPSFGCIPIGNSSDDLRGLPDFTSNSWDAVQGAMGPGEDSHAGYSPSPSRVSEGFDGFMDISIDRLPVTGSIAHPRSPRVFSTTSAPSMRSVSRGSRSSDAASDHVRPRSNSIQEHSKLTSLPTILLDASGAQSIDTNQTSPGSVTSHPPLDQPSSTGQRRILNPNTTSPLLNTALADVTQAIISNVADCLKAGTLDEAQMQSMVQTRLVNLLVSQAPSQRLMRSQSSNRSGTRGAQLSCNECNKSLARKCDLKKHKKRHLKPYGCTFPDCNKVFGSKNDWKRHENSQHFQLECWRCHEPDSSSKINQCAKIFYRREKFTQHLKQDHPKLSDDHIKEEVKRTRIGRSGQEKFWCGFCVKIIGLERKGLEAWDERFNHVDDKHFKRGQLISAWVPIDGHGPKGSRSEDTAQERSPACGQDEEDDDDSGEAEPCQESPPTIPLDNVTVPKRKAAPVINHAHPSKKLQLEKAHTEREALRYCCDCNDGPRPACYNVCTLCDHKYCQSCPTEYIRKAS